MRRTVLVAALALSFFAIQPTTLAAVGDFVVHGVMAGRTVDMLITPRTEGSVGPHALITVCDVHRDGTAGIGSNMDGSGSGPITILSQGQGTTATSLWHLAFSTTRFDFEGDFTQSGVFGQQTAVNGTGSDHALGLQIFVVPTPQALCPLPSLSP